MGEAQDYQTPTGDPRLAFDSSSNLEAISAHIERHWGRTGPIYHEKVSDYVHVDVHVVQATPERPYHTFITSGMSDKPMTVPAGSESCRYAELVLALPPAWPLDVRDFSDPKNYWPIRLLKEAARFPHLYETFLWKDHTFANGNPPQVYADGVPFTASMITYPLLSGPESYRLKISEDKEIHFFALVPLYPEEHERACEMGVSLLQRAMKGKVTELIDLGRNNYGDPSAFMAAMMAEMMAKRGTRTQAPAPKKPWWKIW